jgi:pimeloyl-ACP methyl ester carboxylesterase
MSGVYRTDRGMGSIRDWCARRLDGWPVPHERREIATTAGATHLLIAGQPDAGTVLYFPGTNFNAASSLSVAAELAARVRVVVVDLPGQPGLSEARRPRANRVAAYGAWAGEVVEHVHRSVGSGPLMMVGHSWGAAVALAAPTSHISALALVNPAGLVRLRLAPPVLRATLAWVVRRDDRSSTALLRHLVGPDRQPQPELVEWMTLVGRHTRPTGAPRPLTPRLLTRWRHTSRMVLSGEQDCFLPSEPLGRAVEERLRVRLDVLDRLGHLSVADDPRRVSTLLISAFDTHEPADPGPTRTRRDL